MIELTAESADNVGFSKVGNCGLFLFLCRFLYAMAAVDDEFLNKDSEPSGLHCLNPTDLDNITCL